MTRHEFEMPGSRRITSLVMDEKEFGELCDILETLKFSEHPQEKVKKAVDKMRDTGLVSGVVRGERTEPLFVKYDVKTPVFAACIRGFAGSVLGDTTTVTQDEAIAVLGKEYDKLDASQKHDVDEFALKLLAILKGEYSDKGLANVGPLITRFVAKYMKAAPRQFRLAFVDDSLSGITQTLSARLYQLEDPFSNDFDGYLRRLGTGIVVTGVVASQHDITVMPKGEKDEARGIQDSEPDAPK